VAPTRVLITGGRGKVGRHAADALAARGHHVVLTDIAGARYGPAPQGALPYVRADLTDYGQVVGTVVKAAPEVIVHAAGIPDPAHDAPSVIFSNNVLSTFNIAEASARLGVRRLVYISSETALGFITAERPDAPDYIPVDERHPVRPQDAYALSKALGERICDAVVLRSDVTAVSIRPSLVLDDDDYPNILPRFQGSPETTGFNIWSYVDVRDLAELIALAAEADTAGHEVVYAAAPDNMIGTPLAELVTRAWPDRATTLRPLDRDDASGIDCSKARQLFGWRTTRSWREH
jgi:UDP-glucose 4-epimerase